MPDQAELIKQLSKLPRRDYSELIEKVDAERRQEAERAERGQPVRRGMSRDDFARWIARHHFAIDKGISRIIYLPKDAPEKEVRLLEVNRLVTIPDHSPVMAVDFMPDIEGIDYALFVADVTPRQFEEIEKGQIALPAGWNLEGYLDVTPSAP